tara:strand:- start:1604 stop:2014 length:411 start_codon:yes stop_codon:yes gene_type:complete
MNRIQKLQKNWTDIRGRFNGPLFKKYLKARELSPDKGGPEEIPQDSLDFHVGDKDHFFARLDVVKIIRDEVVIYKLKLDGQIIKEIKCDLSGEVMSVTKFRISKKCPSLWSKGMNIDDLHIPIKKEYKPFKSSHNA